MAAMWCIEHGDNDNVIVLTLFLRQSDLVVSQNWGRVANKKRL